MARDEKDLSVMYGREDLGASPLFQGGFINYGYWPEVIDRPTAADRAEASRRLYEQALDRLALAGGEALLEVGSGRGFGARLALERHRLSRVTGVDATPEQVERARRFQADAPEGLRFLVGMAEDLPVEAARTDAVLSVEAAQHFLSFRAFAMEAHRVLKDSGRLVVTTFFATGPGAPERLALRIPTIAKGIDRVIPIDSAIGDLRDAGFSDVKVESIGRYVWEAFDRWIELTGASDWGREWFRVFRAGEIDYFMLTAAKR